MLSIIPSNQFKKDLKFLKSAVNHDGIPFEVKRISPNAETKAALAEYDQMKLHPENYKRYDSFDDLMNEVLNA